MHLIKFEFLLAYLLGGKADFIVINKTNQHHLNYKILFEKGDDKKKTYYVYFISTKDIYIGSLVVYNSKIFYFYGFEKLEEQFKKQLKVFKSLFYLVFIKKKEPNNIEIGYSGVCFVCGKKLTNPKYIEMGIGEKCLKSL